MIRHIAFCFVFSIICLSGFSQIFPVNPSYNTLLDHQNLDSSWSIHTSLKPVLDERLNPFLQWGSNLPPVKGKRKVWTHLTQEHLLEFDKDEVYISLDPMIDLTLMRDQADTSARGMLFANWRGLRCAGRFGSQVSFQTDFVEVQTRPAEWQREWMDSLQVYPGYGRFKPFQVDAYDFAVSTGSLQYRPMKSLTLRIGSERQFIGNGYRSLLWSDAIFPTPFVQGRWIAPTRKWQYSSSFHLLQTLERLPQGEVPESLFKRKGASVNYLSLKPWRGAELGIFECVIWNMYDSSGTHGPDIGAYIPVLGMNTALHLNDTLNNSLAGFNLSQYVRRNFMLYGQLLLDHFNETRMGWQTGCRLFDAGLQGLNLLLEWNHGSSYLYSFESRLQSYSHIQQSIGHPAGGSFDEFVARLDYRRKRWGGRMYGSYLDQEISAAADIMSRPQDDKVTYAAPAFRTLLNGTVELAFIINPAYSLEVVAGYQFRQEAKNYNWMSDQFSVTRLLYFGLRTSMFSRYNDF